MTVGELIKVLGSPSYIELKCRVKPNIHIITEAGITQKQIISDAPLVQANTWSCEFEAYSDCQVLVIYPTEKGLLTVII